MDVFADEFIDAVADLVVDQVVADVEVFVVGEDQSLVGCWPEVFFDPLEFVAGGGGVFPGWGGEDVDIKMVGEGDEGVDRILEGFHEGEGDDSHR